MLFKTNLARKTWESKYRYKNETPLETFQRVAKAASSVENENVREYWYNEFLNAMIKYDNGEPVGLKCTPGGRITANAGTDYKATTLANCFINFPVENAVIKYTKKVPNSDIGIDCEINTDESPDNLANIMLTLLEQAETLKSEGGYGINFDFIRPRGSVIKGIGIKHPGVIAYMKIWDRVAEIIVQSDEDGYKDKLKNYLPQISDEQCESLKKMARKGAMMGALSVSHPDIEEFVRAKQTPGVLTKFNISVVVDDEFMEAVENDYYYELRFNEKTYKKIKAKELYDLIMESTYNKAEPGILFKDNMSRNNPIEFLGEQTASNPCGEIGGNKYTSTVCNLINTNLTQYVKEDRTFDFESYKHDIEVMTRFMDNLCDITFAPLDQYNWAIKNLRQFGFGVNGLGSSLFMLGLRFGSEEANKFVEKVCSIKEDITWKTSALLAKERGAFPAFSEKMFETNWWKNFTKISKETKELIKQYGVRNAKTTTNAPNGNTSVLCDNVSNGIEPVFQLEYERTYIADKWPPFLDSELIKETFKQEKRGDDTIWIGTYEGIKYLYEPSNRGLCIIETVRDYGYQWLIEKGFVVQNAPILKEELVTTSNLTVKDHLKVQEIVQQNLNQSCSKTINIPADYSFEDFKNVYMEAWKRGLNGITTYRDGTLAGVLNKIEEKEIETVKTDLKLPDTFINGPMKIIKREGCKYYINFSYLPEDKDMKHPVCIWINTNDHGEAVAIDKAVKKLTALLRKYELSEDLIQKQLEKIKGNRANQKLAKMVSMCLRHRLPIVETIGALEGLEDDFISSLLTSVRKFLAMHVQDGTKAVGKQCLASGSERMVYQSGCSTCLDCGNSGCG
jgi:ribonucleoside-diphosphate reductase alpha chain